DLEHVIAAGQRFCEVLQRENGSRVARARLSA
ncbi:hydroxymethylglutaryl-CoA lyase, partial [Pseudomonas syringae pv. tagetis]